MKLGLSIKIDVTKIDKARLFQGEKGTYLDLTTFIDTEQEGQYGDHGFISQSVSKEEREAKVQMPILGNVKVFFSDSQGGQNQAHQASQRLQEPSQPLVEEGFDDDIPF
jgi:hypothetical protein